MQKLTHSENLDLVSPAESIRIQNALCSSGWKNRRLSAQHQIRKESLEKPVILVVVAPAPAKQPFSFPRREVVYGLVGKVTPSTRSGGSRFRCAEQRPDADDLRRMQCQLERFVEPGLWRLAAEADQRHVEQAGEGPQRGWRSLRFVGGHRNRKLLLLVVVAEAAVRLRSRTGQTSCDVNFRFAHAS